MSSVPAQHGTEFWGWTSSPDGRGTWDIIISCLVTTFLCCWTAVYPNVPAITDGRWNQLLEKIYLTNLGLLGPEFLLGVAMGQRESARSSVKVSSFIPR